MTPVICKVWPDGGQIFLILEHKLLIISNAIAYTIWGVHTKGISLSVLFPFTVV